MTSPRAQQTVLWLFPALCLGCACAADFSVSLGSFWGQPAKLPNVTAEDMRNAVHTELEQFVTSVRGVPGISFAFDGGDNFTFTATAGKVSKHSVAAGMTDEDSFIVGSVTKMYTMAGVMQLVASGRVDLDKPAYVYIDPLLWRENTTSLLELFGETSGIQNLTVRHLLAMRSGIIDYTLLSEVTLAYFTSGTRVVSPIECLHLMRKIVPAAGGGIKMLYKPGEDMYRTYSSTNFLLLGLLLANDANADFWYKYDYRNVIPKRVQSQMPKTMFPTHGPLSKYTDVHGYLCGNSTERCLDVWNLSALQASFGCGHLVSTPKEISRFMRLLYGPGAGLWKDEAEALRMRADILTFTPEFGELFTPYGFGTEYFGDVLYTGSESGLSPFVGYGHGGVAFGMLGIGIYIPFLKSSLSMAINSVTNLNWDAGRMFMTTVCFILKRLLAMWQQPYWPPELQKLGCRTLTPHLGGVLARELAKTEHTSSATEFSLFV